MTVNLPGTYNAIPLENMFKNQIFRCDETGLYHYKLLPKKTLASSFEKTTDIRKKQKERVTVNACCNVLKIWCAIHTSFFTVKWRPIV